MLNALHLSYSLGCCLVLPPLLLLVLRPVLIRQALPLLSLSLGPFPCFPRGLLLGLAFRLQSRLPLPPLLLGTQPPNLGELLHELSL